MVRTRLCTYPTHSQRVLHCFSALFVLSIYFVALARNDARGDENLCIRLVHCDITTLKTFSHELAQARLDWRQTYIIDTCALLTILPCALCSRYVMNFASSLLPPPDVWILITSVPGWGGYLLKYNTDISRNAQNLALFRSPSDRKQIGNIRERMFDKNRVHFMKAYYKETEKPFGYLLVDNKPDTPPDKQVFADLFMGNVKFITSL